MEWIYGYPYICREWNPWYISGSVHLLSVIEPLDIDYSPLAVNADALRVQEVLVSIQFVEHLPRRLECHVTDACRHTQSLLRIMLSKPLSIPVSAQWTLVSHLISNWVQQQKVKHTFWLLHSIPGYFSAVISSIRVLRVFPCRWRSAIESLLLRREQTDLRALRCETQFTVFVELQDPPLLFAGHSQTSHDSQRK